jgi:hypothetical protein
MSSEDLEETKMNEITNAIKVINDMAISINSIESFVKMQEFASYLIGIRQKVLFAEAMAAAQAEMKPIIEDEENQQTRSTYASLAAVDDGIRKIYTRHGFSVTFSYEGYDEGSQTVRIIGELFHTGGFSKRYPMVIPADGKGLKGQVNMTRTHATGSAFTYAQRYALKLMFNLAIRDEDDDGNVAGDTGERISEEQLILLDEALSSVGASKPKFCTAFNLAKLSDLPAARFDEAMAMIEKKKNG